MAHNYSPNAELSSQMTLPPIRRICNIAQAPSSKDSNSPVRFLKLPRLERRPNMKSQTALSLQEIEQRNESYKCCVAIDKNFAPLQTATKQGACSLKRWKDPKDTQSREETHVHSSMHRVGSICREGDSSKNAITKDKPAAAEMLRRPVQLLRRRLKACKAYQHGDGQISYEELPFFEQSLDQLRTFTEGDKNFNGGKIDPEKTGNTDITSYIATFEVQRKTPSNKCASTEKTGSDEETDVRVRGRFYEALDHHLYHYYRNTHPERRMAICEEIERTIVVGDLALTCFREHLALQDDMNTWML